MSYLLQHYNDKPCITDDHTSVSGCETEDRSFARFIDEIVRTYQKPYLITWYTLKGNISFYYLIVKPIKS